VVVVPKNIDFNMTADFKQLLYDKMTFTNAKGVLTVLNGDVKFQNMGLQAFGGSMLQQWRHQQWRHQQWRWW
jgi:hypothetical protein